MPTFQVGELSIGDTVGGGRFAVVGTLGVGGQGRTYEAIDKTTGIVVALKCFWVRGAASWKDVELAEREASVLAGLQHPLLPKYLTHFEERGALFLAMDRVEGRTLKQLSAERKLGQADVVNFLNDAATTLSYLHGRAPPVIHRDIKPANVIQRTDGRYALVDFGSVAQAFKPEGGSTVVGTYGYMAPEQFQGRAMPASDLYSVAATALAMLTGTDPDQLPHKGLGIDVAACLGNEVEPPLRALLIEALDPDPDARARLTLAERLRNHGYRGEAQPPAAPPPAPKDGARRNFTPGVFLIVMVGLMLARVATAVLMRFALPTLLTFLSFFFGAELKRAAQRVSRAGLRAVLGLEQASEKVRSFAGQRGRQVVDTDGDEVKETP
ncbi:MAG: hypothetical protein RJA70_3341, partial [Pseudomonadota bacterium]